MDERLKQIARGEASKVEPLVQYLYDHPETAQKEKLSSAAIVKVLRDNGFAVTYPYLEKELGYGTAFMGIFHNGEGPQVDILVEYDALPEIGHGCGHNLHGPLAVLAALILKRMAGEFHGTLRVIGTPAEEEEGAKLHMAEWGIFDHSDLAIMMHSGSGPASQTNMCGTALRCYVVEFYGKSAHAAGSPWLGHNALTAARKFLDLVDARRDAFHPGSIVTAVILDGGQQPNMVPDYAKVRMEFRAGALNKLQELDRIIRNCARGACIALDCEEKFSFGFPDFYDMVRLPSLEAKIADNFRALGAKIKGPEPSGTSTDVGNVSYHCPAIQPIISITDEHLSLHTPEMRDATLTAYAFSQLEVGALVMARTALQIFSDENFRSRVRAEFNAAMQEKKG